MKRMYTGNNWFVPFQEGDHDAFAYMFGQHYSRLLAVANKKLDHDPFAVDIVQDVFRKAYNDCTQFRSAAHLRHWLYQVTAHDCISYQRKLSRHRKALMAQAAAAGRIDEGLDGERLYEEMRGEMYRKMELLPDDKRMILEMVLAKKSTQQIADELGIKPAEVAVRLFRARKMLKGLLAGSGIFLWLIISTPRSHNREIHSPPVRIRTVTP